MLRLAVAVFVGKLESVTFTVNENVPVAVGTPEMSPVPVIVSPVGNEPDETIQV